MTRLLIAAVLAAAPAATLVGCGGGKPEAPAAAPASQSPNASEMFDKKRAPAVRQDKRVNPG